MTHAPELTESDNMPVYFCNILHALRMYDRFENTFLRWSVSKQRDRQQLVLTLADDATLSQSIVSTICMMYPRRIAGPFLCKNTFTVEFLDETTKYDDSVAVDGHGALVPGATANRKRHRQPPNAGDYIEGITRDTHEHLSALNTSDVTVSRTTSGEDSDGQWISLELNETSRINLCFMCNVYTGEYSDVIKVCMCGVWVCGCVVCGCVGVWVCGCVGVWVCVI